MTRSVTATAGGPASGREGHLVEAVRVVDVASAQRREAKRRELAGNDGDKRAEPLRHAGDERERRVDPPEQRLIVTDPDERDSPRAQLVDQLVRPGCAGARV